MTATTNLSQLTEQYKTLIAQARALTGDGTTPISPDNMKKAQELLGKSDELRAQINLLQQVGSGEEFLNQPAGTKAAHVGWRQALPDEGNVPVDEKAWRELEVPHPLSGKAMRVRYQVPLAVQGKNYPYAFEAYIRKGINSMGSEDRKTLTEGIDTAGGYLAPEQYQAELIKKTATNAVIRSLARVITTSRDMVKWPRVTYTTDDKYTSGVRLTWTGESPSSSTVHRVTDPVIGVANIPVHTAMASMPISNDLLEDAAFDVAMIGSDLMGEAFALGEDDAFINGDGAAKPMGIATRVDVGEDKVSFVVSGSASAVTADGLIDLLYGLPAQYRRNARFVMNSGTAKAIRKLKDSTNNRYLWDQLNGGLASPGEQDSILGKVIAYDEFVPDIASNAYAIIFGDLGGYMVIDRVGLSIQRLSELYAELNVTLLLARKRVGGDVIQPWRMRVQKIST